jgi:hypothetical protein
MVHTLQGAGNEYDSDILVTSALASPLALSLVELALARLPELRDVGLSGSVSDGA